MRDDALAYALDRNRHYNISPDAAKDLYLKGEDSVVGQDVARAYGLLAHYVNADRLALIYQSGNIGPGCWLALTGYAACMSPYNLGLNSPRNMCLLVDVSEVSDLWGPGTCPGSSLHPNIWRGGGIEFSTPDPIPFSAVRHIVELHPCGDEH